MCVLCLNTWLSHYQKIVIKKKTTSNRSVCHDSTCAAFNNNKYKYVLISVMTLTLLDINQILLSPNPNTFFLDTFFYRDAAYFYFYLVHVFLSAAQVVMQIYFKVQFNRNITGNYKHRKRLPVKVSVCMLKRNCTHSWSGNMLL